MEGYIEKAVTLTPARRTRRKEVLTEKEFGEKVDLLAVYTSILRELSERVYALPTGKRLCVPPVGRFKEGLCIGRPEIKSLYKQLQDAIKDLKPYYKAALPRKRKVPTEETNEEGVPKTPRNFKVICTPVIVNFFKAVAAGTNGNTFSAAYENTGQGYQKINENLIEILPLFDKYGFAYGEAVADLFYIFMVSNNLMHGNKYSVNPLFEEYFGETLNIINEERKNQPPEINPKTGKLVSKEQLDLENLNITVFYSIIKWNHYYRPGEEQPKGANVPLMNDEQLAMFNNPEYRGDLVEERNIILATKEAWKELKAKTKTQAKTPRRRIGSSRKGKELVL